eukprot:Selendium_serpulae@DN5364_c0_g1_i3.p3
MQTGRPRAPVGEQGGRRRGGGGAVFHRFGVIDYAALGGEARAMKTFPFAEYRVNVMTMTRPSDEVVDLLIAHDYVPISLLSKDGETLWTHKAFALAPQEARGLAESVWRYAGRVDEAVAPRLATAFARLWPDMHGR